MSIEPIADMQLLWAIGEIVEPYVTRFERELLWALGWIKEGSHSLSYC